MADNNRCIIGDCREVLKTLPAKSVQCVVTSPPYWGLRDYGTAKWEGGDAACDHSARTGDLRFEHAISEKQKSNAGSAGSAGSHCVKCGALRIDSQLGLEATPQAYVERMVEVFRAVREALADDGTLWLNLGDSYVSVGTGTQGDGQMADRAVVKARSQVRDNKAVHDTILRPPSVGGLQPKNLIGIPWRVAFALQADGWYLRQDIIWSKPNPMPESVRDRCTKAHEYIFLLSKNERYHFDADAIAEQAAYDGPPRRADSFMRKVVTGTPPGQPAQHREDREDISYSGTRNKRSVWEVTTQPFKEAHFATFPPALIEPCILAGCPVGGVVLDPFFGSGTTGEVCERLGRQWLGIELNPAYVKLANQRTAQQGLALSNE